MNEYDWTPILENVPKGYVNMTGIEVEGHGACSVFAPSAEMRFIEDTDLIELTTPWQAFVPISDLGVPMGKWKVLTENKPFILPNLMLPWRKEETPEKGDRIRFGYHVWYYNASDYKEKVGEPEGLQEWLEAQASA
jgi:hypothetical protein